MSEVGEGGGAVGLITGCYVLFIWAYNWAVWEKATYKFWGGGGEYKQNDSSVHNN